MSAPSGDLLQVLEQVVDPELPFLSIVDLGIVHDVAIDGAGAVHVALCPTYSGCPATETIETDVRAALRAAGYPDVQVRQVLSPAWSTDQLTDAARAALRANHIAPPTTRPVTARFSEARVSCPRCGSAQTHCVSPFGSTACKALYCCDACLEPFDHFKCV